MKTSDHHFLNDWPSFRDEPSSLGDEYDSQGSAHRDIQAGGTPSAGQIVNYRLGSRMFGGQRQKLASPAPNRHAAMGAGIVAAGWTVSHSVSWMARALTSRVPRRRTSFATGSGTQNWSANVRSSCNDCCAKKRSGVTR